MEIYTKRTREGDFQVSMGHVTFQLPETAINKLKEVIHARLNKSSEIDSANIEKKLIAYKNLVNKLVEANDRVVQEFAVSLVTEQLVTVARLANGTSMFDKIIKNLSKQNAEQFKMDYDELNEITEYQAIVYMEQAIPVIRKVANKVQDLTR